ncbi:MAG TPA: hypothetical protein PK668_08830 [Myxococcota bacterium]|nr:hypothetical protein [Myxococcota bacterium]HRY92917.1 hypothetical protein [Myxococcota bacterium]HSA19864.1 hypothetical protein [Myxococcota bacterium]
MATKKAKATGKPEARTKAPASPAAPSRGEEQAALAAVEQVLRGLEPRFEELGARLAEQIAARLEESGLLARLAGLVTATRAAPGADEPARAGGCVEGEGEGEGEGKTCAEQGCTEPARARGLCSKHYQRQRYAEKRQAEEREAGPDAKPRRGGGSCEVEGCGLTVYARGMCSKHFMEWVRTRKKA